MKRSHDNEEVNYDVEWNNKTKCNIRSRPLNTHSCFICGVNKLEKLSYFTFPKDRTRCQEWKERFKIDASSNVSNARLCSKHFIVQGRKVIGFVDNMEATSELSCDWSHPEKNHQVCVVCWSKPEIDCENLSYFKIRPQWTSLVFDYDTQVIMGNVKVPRICSIHFRRQDFSREPKEGCRLRLKKDAVPSLFLNPNTDTELNDTQSGPNNLERDSIVPMEMDLEMSTPLNNEDTTGHYNLRDTTGLSTPQRTRDMHHRSGSRVPRYPGDIHTPQLETPRRRSISFQVLRKHIAKQQKKINELNQKLRRAQKKIQTLTGVLQHLRSHGMVSQQLNDTLLNELPPIVKQLALRRLKNKRKKFEPELRKFALTLRFYSPQAYKYVREKWGKLLPHPGSLRKWICSVNLQPGFNKEVFDFLKKRHELNGNEKLLCNLVVDEMSIRQKLDIKKGKKYGCVNLGIPEEKGETMDSDNEEEISDTDDEERGELPPLAKNAFMFLLVALNSSWKVPIAYFFVDTLNGTEKACLLKQALIKIEACNVIVRSVTFDGAKSNFTMATKLGASFDLSDADKFKPHIPHPVTKEPVYILPDPCHMMKNIRNSFGSTVTRNKTGELLYTSPFRDSEGRKISWEFIEGIVNVQESNGLRGGKCKMNKRHIQYKDNKMNVRLAVQTLSNSTASLLRYMVKKKETEFADAEATACFCSIFNDAFDVLNCRKYKNFENEYGRPICDKFLNKLRTRASEIIGYILILKDHKGQLIINGGKKCGFVGLIICLKNIFPLFEQFQKFGLKFLLTYNLLQDHIENFFSCIRMRGGFNNNPSAHQFMCAYRQLVIHHEIRASEAANCSDDGFVPILSVTDCGRTPEVYEFEMDSKVKFNFEGVTIPSDFINDVADYIGGCIIHKMQKKFSVSCTTCFNSFIDPTRKSALIDAYSKGRMKIPSESLSKLFRRIEIYIRDNGTKIFDNSFVTAIVRNLKEEMYPTFGCGHESDNRQHRLQFFELIIFYYVKIRLYHESDILACIDKNIRRVYTKLIHYSHQ